MGMTSDAAALGKNVQRIRQEYGASTYDVAEVARMLGMDTWTGSAISQIEAGKYKATIGNAAVLSAVLSQIAKRPVSLAELLGGEALSVTPGLSMSTEAIAKWLGAGVDLNDFTLSDEMDQRWSKDLAAQLGELADQLKAKPELWAEGFAEYRRKVAATAEADARIARTMGLSPDDFYLASIRAWGHPFTYERDHRAGPEANAQRRGRITRDMKDELRRAMESEHGDRR